MEGVGADRGLTQLGGDAFRCGGRVWWWRVGGAGGGDGGWAAFAGCAPLHSLAAAQPSHLPPSHLPATTSHSRPPLRCLQVVGARIRGAARGRQGRFPRAAPAPGPRGARLCAQVRQGPSVGTGLGAEPCMRVRPRRQGATSAVVAPTPRCDTSSLPLLPPGSALPWLASPPPRRPRSRSAKRHTRAAVAAAAVAARAEARAAVAAAARSRGVRARSWWAAAPARPCTTWHEGGGRQALQRRPYTPHYWPLLWDMSVLSLPPLPLLMSSDRPFWCNIDRQAGQAGEWGLGMRHEVAGRESRSGWAAQARTNGWT